jgi:hypothetical protein
VPLQRHDPDRNPHRHANTWALRTIAEMLANPRYTGRQVWNRHRTDHRETVAGDKRTGTASLDQVHDRRQHRPIIRPPFPTTLRPLRPGRDQRPRDLPEVMRVPCRSTVGHPPRAAAALT